MAEEAPAESIPPRMTNRLPNFASMYDPDFLELAWENGQIVIRGLTSKVTKRKWSSTTGFPSSRQYFSQRENEEEEYDFNNVVPEPDGREGYVDKQLNYNTIDTHVVPVNKFKDLSRQSYVSKLEEEIPLREDSDNCEVPDQMWSPLKQYCETNSVPLMRSKEKNSRIDDDIEKRKSSSVNFSIFLRPDHPPGSCGATIRPTHSRSSPAAEEDINITLQGNARSSAPTTTNNPFHMTKLTNDSKYYNINATSSQKLQRNVAALPHSDLDPLKKSQFLPDEQSEAGGYKDTPRFSYKVNGKSTDKMVASSSACSRGASNCPQYTSKWRYEDADDLSSEINATEEGEGMTKAAAPARGSKGGMAKRKAEVHNLSEKKRRDKINKKMRALQQLIPNCHKVDKASMLDQAIEYLKTLQLQVQMMSMGSSGVYMPPMMLAAAAMQHINAQHLASSMAAGLGMRMQMGVGCGPTQFPTTPLLSGAAAACAALPGIPEARVNMLGFPTAQVLMMSMSRSPNFASLAADAAAAAAAAGIFSPQLSVLHAPAGLCQSVAQPNGPAPPAIPLSTSNHSNPT